MRNRTILPVKSVLLVLAASVSCGLDDPLDDFLLEPIVETPGFECATIAFLCDDDLFCNGTERCLDGECDRGPFPCQGACDEESNTCSSPCVEDQCGDDLFCNGVELCVINDANPGGVCTQGDPPCFDGEVCIESRDVCVECEVATDCPDGQRCIDDFCEVASDMPTSVTVFLRNEDITNVHILTASESFGSSNRLAPDGQRTVTLPPSLAGDVFTFRAGRNGSVFATVDCTLAPDTFEDAVVTWTGFELTCTGDLFK